MGRQREVERTQLGRMNEFSCSQHGGAAIVLNNYHIYTEKFEERSGKTLNIKK